MSLQYHHQSSFPSCFRPCTAADNTYTAPPPPPPPSQTSGKTNLTTSLYQTNLGLFSLTWSRTFLGHSLHLHLHPSSHYSPSSPLSISTLHFHLHIKPFIFWKKHGHKKLRRATVPDVQVYWDLSRAEFGSGPEPESGFYIAIVADGEMVLLVGDSSNEAYSRIRVQKPGKSQALVLRREHVHGNDVHNTKARFGGKNREISIEFDANDDGKLRFSVDKNRVLQVKRIKWKFRGNERIEVEGVSIQVSWDVHNWLFHNDLNNGQAVFMFKFENEGSEILDGGEVLVASPFNEKILSQQSSCINGIEWRKMRKSFLSGARSSSSSSISMSSGSSGGSSSVMEWASVEESELSAHTGFSLLVYAWKK